MERADHFSAQDHPGRRRQELRHPRRTTGRCAERDSRPRQRHSFAFGETEWDDGRAKTGEGPAQQEDHDRAGKAADGLVLTKMAVKSEKDLGEQLRGHWLKAVAAIELRNFGYAISLLQGILKQEPEF